MATQPALSPMPTALGINPSYCLNKQTTLCMKEKVFSLAGDTFRIVDENNQPVLQCKGRVMTLHAQKEFADNAGRPLFFLRQKIFAFLKTFHGETPDGKQLFEVKSKFHIGRARMTATFNNVASDSQPKELMIKGSWFDRSATITLDDVVVAQIARKFLNMRFFLGDAGTYYVTIAPGVDVSLIAAICVCIDEREKEESGV